MNFQWQRLKEEQNLSDIARSIVASYKKKPLNSEGNGLGTTQRDRLMALRLNIIDAGSQAQLRQLLACRLAYYQTKLAGNADHRLKFEMDALSRKFRQALEEKGNKALASEFNTAISDSNTALRQPQNLSSDYLTALITLGMTTGYQNQFNPIDEKLVVAEKRPLLAEQNRKHQAAFKQFRPSLDNALKTSIETFNRDSLHHDKPSSAEHVDVKAESKGPRALLFDDIKQQRASLRHVDMPQSKPLQFSEQERAHLTGINRLANVEPLRGEQEQFMVELDQSQDDNLVLDSSDYDESSFETLREQRSQLIEEETVDVDVQQKIKAIEEKQEIQALKARVVSEVQHRELSRELADMGVDVQRRVRAIESGKEASPLNVKGRVRAIDAAAKIESSLGGGHVNHRVQQFEKPKTQIINKVPVNAHPVKPRDGLISQYETELSKTPNLSVKPSLASESEKYQIEPIAVNSLAENDRQIAIRLQIERAAERAGLDVDTFKILYRMERDDAELSDADIAAEIQQQAIDQEVAIDVQNVESPKLQMTHAHRQEDDDELLARRLQQQYDDELLARRLQQEADAPYQQRQAAGELQIHAFTTLQVVQQVSIQMMRDALSNQVSLNVAVSSSVCLLQSYGASLDGQIIAAGYRQDMSLSVAQANVGANGIDDSYLRSAQAMHFAMSDVNGFLSAYGQFGFFATPVVSSQYQPVALPQELALDDRGISIKA